MRRLLESLVPDTRPIYWRLVGGVFALYVALLLSAASVFVGHESTRKLAQDPAATVAMPDIAGPLRHAARYDD